MDKVAAGLLELQNNGVSVIYRPLHEMNGDWFWWGPKDRNNVSQTRKDLYKSLYQDMYNYFTFTKGLNNLIWVYSPDAGPSNKSAYYPGQNYVDIVGLDAYHDTPAQIQGYAEMLAFNKPFAFAEVGPKTLNSNFDYQTFINALKNHFPESIYFIPWNTGWSPLNNSQQATLNIDLTGIAGLEQVKEIRLFLSLDSGSGQTAIYLDNVRTN